MQRQELYRVRADDIVISNINAVNGAVAIVPKKLDGAVVTSEFTVCRAKGHRSPLSLDAPALTGGAV